MGLIYYWTAVSFLLGGVIGSFLNVVVYRLPRGESLVRPRSHCPHCGTFIKWHDNVPVLSWLLLRGRCRTCHAPISLRYPVVELVTASSFALAWLHWGLSWPLIPGWVLIALTIACVFIYHDHSLVPDVLFFPGLGVAVGGCVGLHSTNCWMYALGGFAAASLVAVLSRLLGKRRRRCVRQVPLARKGTGMAELKLTLMGAFTAGLSPFLGIFLGVLLGACCVSRASLRKNDTEMVAVSASVTAGTVVALMSAGFLLNQYLQLHG